MRIPQYQHLTLEQLVARLNAHAFIADEPKEQNMPKIVKKFEHAKTVRAAQAKYDWQLILSGQNVQLDAGIDYDTVGTDKDGKEFDRTDGVVFIINEKARRENKHVNVTKVGPDGKPLADRKAKASGLVVTARNLTQSEIEARDDRREKMKIAREAAKTNGTAAPAPTQIVAVEPEPI